MAQSTWQEQIGTFRIGLVTEPGGDNAIEGLPALRKAYALALGVPVEFFVASDYRALIEAQASGRSHYGIYSASAYAAAALSCDCVSPLVAPTGSSGAVGIRSVLIARAGSMSAMSDISRHRVAVGGPDDVTGFLMPLAAMRREGVASTGGEAFLIRTASAEEAQARLLAGEVDAMFGWIETGVGKRPMEGSGTLEQLAAAGAGEGAFRVIWTSDLLRYGPHAIGKHLDPEVRRRLVPFLVGLKDSDPELFGKLERHHAGGFSSVKEADYETALELVRDMAGLEK
ncbi:phosphate/phosphite/phosphonate ABC transporter substrate-binding protein [Arvimicrobium flavum]|uniref:phosphate/phosphite/phosphonate ABC transporter substrate-binding protein n=1 Tax=Arvimicrobium flavum TaxID=3393320 RepID=UPI00237B8BD1|nr:PhnD/SsuA/transferrin family substrate-binding protein [Mesorhizobium shangrilense]